MKLTLSGLLRLVSFRSWCWEPPSQLLLGKTVNEDLHIHFESLIAPFESRLIKVEALTGHMEGDLKELSGDVKDLKMVLEQHSTEERKILSDINANISANHSEVKSIKSWLIGIGTGFGLLIGLLTLLFKLGILHAG